MQYTGLISEYQKPVNLALPYWDYGVIENGVKKIDSMMHFGCFSLGYNQPDLVKRVCEITANIKPEIAETLVPNEPLYLNQVAFELQDKLFELTGYHSFYCLSGSDANEGAVKLSSAYHYANENFDKKYIVTLDHSYHGSTFLSSSLGCENLMSDPFYNLPKYKAIKRVNRNFKIEDVNWNEVGAFVVETCTYGQGMREFSVDFWEKLRYLQQEKNVLIVIDDIFMGGGKTGNWVGWKHLPIEPDIFTQGKSITAGFFPLSITYYNDRVKNALPRNFRWDHGFTYNFSVPGIVSTLETIKIIEEQNLLDRHNDLVLRASSIFKSKGAKFISRFGLCFMIAKPKAMMYIIPLNATDEYFEILENTL